MGLPVEVNNLMMGAVGGYQISRSLRFRSSASAYLNRTPASTGNRQKFTWSCWVKRGLLTTGTYYQLFGAGGASTNEGIFFDTSAGGIYFTVDGGTTATVTSAVFRDPSAWYHIVAAIDTTQATAANRIIVYINGIQQTAYTGGYPAQNTNFTFINVGGTQHRIGAHTNSGYYFDGYMADVYFIDGQALTPSSFGETDSITGVWNPKKYSGTYGTNGFYLNFSDNSGATATTIGKDSSGNGNNWTPNNISVTAGTTYDSMIDSPTPYADGGNGRGNYAVLNPIGKSGGTITDGNLQWASGGVDGAQATASIALLPNTGKFYCEILIGSKTTIYWIVGLVESRAVAWSGTAVVYYGQSPYQSIAQGDVIGITVDTSNGAYQFYKNGSSTSMPSGTITLTGQPIYFGAVEDSSGGAANYTFNFGQRPFSYTPPSGFKALNTYNLPAPSIANGAKHFAATLWTGNGTSQSIANSQSNGGNNALGSTFQPDLVWIKSRSQAAGNELFDVLRGVNQVIYSNATNAETNSGTMSAFNSNGFTVVYQASDVSTNNNGQTYVGWQWKGGGTGVTNNSGSITSTVSANTTAGFSVVTYSGNSATATVGHGLGVAPSMYIVKSRTYASGGWSVYHTSIGATGAVQLNSTSATITSANWWNNTAPTSSVFSLAGVSAEVNTTGNTYVAYCFAAVRGYSAFGSYTGNGSTDGPFTYLGFRPRFIMIKRTDTTMNWYIFDTSRDTYNVEKARLFPNLSDAESTNADFADYLSNGFKLRSSDISWNASGGTYIYAAFAESPFNLSRAR